MDIDDQDLTADLLERLYPLNRSLSSEDTIRTLHELARVTPIEIKFIPAGTRVFDWTVPERWDVRDAYIASAEGARLVDFSCNNLHVVSYSAPVDKMMFWDELETHLHFDRSRPEAIPYRTTYYAKDWGFCVRYDQVEALREAPQPYRVHIDSSFKDEPMAYGEILVPGKFRREILISTYICHPSMANDNLSGMVLTALLASYLQTTSEKHAWSFRIVFVPETIGAVAYAAREEDSVKKISIGFVVTTVGGPGPLAMKKSWNEMHYINAIAERVVRDLSPAAEIYPFDIHGSDERQYSSPAFRINTITIGKSLYYRYNEYHTSLDNLSLVSAANIKQSLEAYKRVISDLNDLRFFARTDGRGEPMLSKLGLYNASGGGFLPSRSVHKEDLVLLVLFWSDGEMSTWELATKIGVEVAELNDLCEELCTLGLLEEV